MLHSFKAENFRGFKKFELPKLNRINLIIGKNNVGKTALLEAISLLVAANNPSLTFALNQYRGLRFVTKLDSEEIWGWFFHQREMGSPLNIEAKDDADHRHHLKITLELPEKKQIDPNIEAKEASFNVPKNKELIFRYQRDKEAMKITRAGIHENRLVVNPSEPVFPESRFLPSNQRFNPADNAELFSRLQNMGKQGEILDIMKIIEPELVSLSVSYVSGMANVVAGIGKNPLMPINVMGDGMTRLLSILLSIANIPNGGCFLIDEIENGFYYETMQKIWKAIGMYSEKFNVQVIATTHSFECVRAAHEAYKDNNVYPLSVHRLEKTYDKIQAITYNKKTLGTSFELGWEIR